MRSSTAALRLHVESALAGRVPAPFRLRDTAPPVVVPTGIAALDEFAGGLPRGCLTEIYGPPCSGKTSILHSALAARTSASEACALVDAQDAFDPASSEASGVFLPKLLWVRSHGLEQAFRSLDLLLQGGGFGFVVLDIAEAPVRLVRKVPLNVWFRLRRAVEDTSTIMLVLSQESNAKTCASLVLRVEREVTEWAGSSTDKSVCATAAAHTPGCLLQGASHAAEVVRSLAKHKRPRAIDQPNPKDASESCARFRLQANPYAAQSEFLDGSEFGGPPPASAGRQKAVPTTAPKDLEAEREERMQNPG
jgi:recombination protein RecA